jgi:hypothetical protein
LVPGVVGLFNGFGDENIGVRVIRIKYMYGYFGSLRVI